MEERRFVYLDLDCFFCACEILRDRTLLHLPFAVGGPPQQRGVVASASYPARIHGVRSAMPMSKAMRLCPELRVVSAHFDDYGQRSREVMEYLRTISPIFEQRSIDEAVLDVCDVSLASLDLAQEIQHSIRQRFRLPCSIGVAKSIMMAKIAIEVGKKQGKPGKVPQALVAVPNGEERAFLAPLPIGIMPGIGPKMEATLFSMGIVTLGQLADWPMLALQKRFGRYGLMIQRLAQGVDTSEIETTHQRKAISQEHTFARDVIDADTLVERLREQSYRVSRELQTKKMDAQVVKMKVRWEDFTTLTRQITLPEPTDDAEVLLRVGVQLFEQVWIPDRPVRLIGLGVSGLQTVRQLRLWEQPQRELTCV